MADNDIRPRLFYQTAKPSTKDDLYTKLAPAEEDGGNTWNYSTDKETNINAEPGKELRHLPAPNTLFINSNIALTDGKDKRISASKTIPNLYDAIDTMATRIQRLEETDTDDPSTADKNLLVTKDDFVKCPDGTCRATTLTIAPGTTSDYSTSANADSIDGHIDRISIQNAANTARVHIAGNKDPEIRVAVGDNNHITVDDTGITLNGNDIRFNCKGFTKNGKDAMITMQAIVEAIRELNRRTAYIDSTLGIEEAVDYFDVHDEEIDGVYANQLDDGLPAATNGHHSGHFIEYHPADADCICKKAYVGIPIDIEHNSKIKQEFHPDTGKPADLIIETAYGDEMKNMQGAQPIERGFDAEDDPEVITVENQSVRMRGCPYLML